MPHTVENSQMASLRIEVTYLKPDQILTSSSPNSFSGRRTLLIFGSLCGAQTIANSLNVIRPLVNKCNAQASESKISSY